MKRIAITGAGSFIGQALTACADGLGWEPVLVTRPGHSLGNGPSSGRFVELAMEDYARLGEAVGPCDCLVLLAWNGTRGAARMDAALQQRNLDTSLTGIRSALAAGCRRIVLAGSQAEYGPHDGPITEESACRPNTEYGRAKLALYRQAEALCREWGAVLAEPRFFSVWARRLPGYHGLQHPAGHALWPSLPVDAGGAAVGFCLYHGRGPGAGHAVPGRLSRRYL